MFMSKTDHLHVVMTWIWNIIYVEQGKIREIASASNEMTIIEKDAGT